jgi:hypothetical protein
MVPKGYWREIAAVLLLKAAGLTALYFLIVAVPGPTAVTPAEVAGHLASTASAGVTP